MGRSSEYENLRTAIFEGDRETAITIGHDLVVAEESILNAIEAASGVIREVGDKFGAGEMFLPEMVLAAEAMQAFMDVATPRLKAEAAEGESISRGKVVIGTVQGDIHSIGKNIVATMLGASGYEVVDLGVNVAPMDAIKVAEGDGASIMGLSALMTTSMPYQKEVVELLEAMNERDDYWVIVGGGPVTSDFAHDIGANGWGSDAGMAVQICDQILSLPTTPATSELVHEATE